MSDTSTRSTLFNAVLNDGAVLDGTWAVTYNAADMIVSVTATFAIFDPDGSITLFTSPTVDPSYNPLGGAYEIQMTGGIGGDFSSLQVAWTGELPTTLTIGDIGTTPATAAALDSAPGVLIGLSSTTGTVTSAIVCFCAGTRIRTTDGEVPVESLAIGHTVLTAAGPARPIRWIGHRTIDLARHPEPVLVRPIRIAAGALADGIPARDLRVSPDHAMLVDGALIPARLLVNHRSITEETDATSVTYFHVELDSHDLILAEGAPTESYLDTGNRNVFANGPVTAMIPDMSVAQRLRMPENGACLPLVTDADAVFPIWQRLADRAGTGIGQGPEADDAAASQDGTIALMVGARTLRPVVAEGGTLIFALPRDADRVRVVSAAMRPNKGRPWIDDRRTLGVAVTGVIADHTAIPLDGPAFGAGWWRVEETAAATFRWTNGDAELALPTGAKLVTIRVHAAMAEADAAKAA
jgi:hypothetical protein